jgi:hypothetical protein
VDELNEFRDAAVPRRNVFAGSDLIPRLVWWLGSAAGRTPWAAQFAAGGVPSAVPARRLNRRRLDPREPGSNRHGGVLDDFGDAPGR